MNYKELRTKVVKEVDGLTTLERKMYRLSFDNEVKRLRLEGSLGENELPNEKQIDDWKISMDKNMIIKLCKSVHKRIFNYRRKIYGMSSIASDVMVGYMIKGGIGQKDDDRQFHFINPIILYRCDI